jgi:endonuclease YncB( thermonuclease family)
MGRYTAVLAVALGMLSALAWAADDMPAEGESAVVAAVIDGDTLRLANGRILRLSGILAPKEGRMRAAAREALSRLALDHRVVLAFGTRHMDRHGRLMAHAWLADGVGEPSAWLQGALLVDGLARVASSLDNRSLVADMLRLEEAARRARRGLWADANFRVRTPEDAGGALDSFQIVEGRPLAAAVVRGRGYLNFGAEHKTDFTLSFSREALRLLRQAGIDFAALAGVRLRARGWLRAFNGPLIDITHPEQIEVLE